MILPLYSPIHYDNITEIISSQLFLELLTYNFTGSNITPQNLLEWKDKTCWPHMFFICKYDAFTANKLFILYLWLVYNSWEKPAVHVEIQKVPLD